MLKNYRFKNGAIDQRLTKLNPKYLIKYKNKNSSTQNEEKQGEFFHL
jgi:hypothetical protein